jgi:hypothetical protein
MLFLVVSHSYDKLNYEQPRFSVVVNITYHHGSLALGHFITIFLDLDRQRENSTVGYSLYTEFDCFCCLSVAVRYHSQVFVVYIVW